LVIWPEVNGEYPAMDMRKLVGQNFARLRKEKGFTQEEFEARSGFSQQYISGLENGARNPTIITLYELAQVLGVDCVELLKPAVVSKKRTR
jgi:transcriptional regulator with XRE-family HTH domain